MDRQDVLRVQTYLRRVFKNDDIDLRPGPRPDSPVELYIHDEFLAVIYRNVDEGEVSFDLTMSILEMDLPPAR